MPTSKPPILTYDTELMSDRKVGPAGMPEADQQSLVTRLTAAKSALLRKHGGGSIGFLTIPDRVEEIRAVEKLARDVARKFKTLIVCGIGGSDLGARAIVHALGVPGKGMEVRFIGANTDPDEIAALLEAVDLRKCAINVISKSGDTLETMSTFLVLRDALIRKVGTKKHSAHVIATTDATAGTLHEIAKREGYRTLPVPRDIGGRFSALTTVGLFPAACAGIAVRKLIAGAASVRSAFEKELPEKNAATLFAGMHVEADEKRRQNISVLMPYSAGLRDFAFWFRQLWAESLGKDGKGLTPVAALGATDQHSQIQLYDDGPADKIVTFIEVAKFRRNLRVPKAFTDLPAMAWIGGKRFSEIIHAERAATARALADAGKPSGTLHIPAVTPESVGALMMHFMIATAVAAELTGVNAYDQPGVEAGKRLIKEMLS